MVNNKQLYIYNCAITTCFVSVGSDSITQRQGQRKVINYQRQKQTSTTKVRVRHRASLSYRSKAVG